ncbi:c-type cytochrome [Tundrisphaera sp. TA3]|uniref:c-type cytochrome n=1 Tax=Tundrisphaera sp. TA3 TaxID=3435775 RepID=UPI003EBB4FDC
MFPIRFRAPSTALIAAALVGLSLFASARGVGAQDPAAKAEAKAKAKAKAKKAAPQPNKEPAASGDKLRAPKGFKVELIHPVPRESQGSWVNLAIDPKGRIIASDQYGKLYRLTPPPVGGPIGDPKVEPIPVEIGEAQGLLWAFDSLYVVVNTGGTYKSGLYRVTDTNNDDQLDKVEMLRELQGSGEHGPHGVALSPDGKSLYVVAGNATKLTEIDDSLVPRVWGEDNLLPRMTDGRGFMRDEKAPGGCIYKVSPDGKHWELTSMGYRNQFDLAFHRDGDLFTYDSDMEWDMNTPWYRPTRVCFAASGADFGYRNGAGKWPTYYFDSLPPVVNIGPGSPTGVAFGYGAKFPAKYQDALFICDWSYGKLYAVHLKPQGAAYGGDLEEFITGSPLPLTDLVVHPGDGAMYFAIGGRRTTSGLYRVTYTGEESTAPSTTELAGADLRAIRKQLEAFHEGPDPKAVETAWPYLSHEDRFIRYAARVAIEHQDPASWADKALAETNPQASLEALLALAQVSAQDPAHRSESDPKPDPKRRGEILDALARLDWAKLSYQQKLDLLRVHAVTLNRMGKPDEAAVAKLIARFDPAFPASGRELNIELSNLLIYLEAPDAAAKTVALMEKAPTQEERIDYARSLRTLKTGWTPKLREAYFSWFLDANNFKGGASLDGFLKNIKNDALATLSEEEKVALKPIIEAQPKPKATAAAASRPFVKAWTLEELVPLVESGLGKKRDYDHGRTLFAATQCFSCHRYDNEGGAAGPDLTGVAGRYSTRDLLEQIIVPSKVISDQYEAITVATTDGKVYTGRVVNLNGDNMMINTDMLDPNAQVSINRNDIEESKPSPISMMPEGLLSTLNEEEILDLVAYLLSRGDRNAKMFH